MARNVASKEPDFEASGEHWMSYSDLMAGLLMIFALILTLSMFISSQEHREQTRERDTQLQIIKRQQDELKVAKQNATNRLGIRRDIIEALGRKLRNYNVRVDPQTGAIQIDAGILFGQDEAAVSDGGKTVLEDVMQAYTSILLDDEAYRRHLSRIIIEGHTNDDGSYLYNLELSQRRALNVMKHILETRGDASQQERLREYLVASGRSETDLIAKDEGKVDKERSRRIEIKFSLKDEDTIKELLEILKSQL
jgi:outer membrane protein OmpA-like peptidoglycan-associated protein